jgi:hypothetical protein
MRRRLLAGGMNRQARRITARLGAIVACGRDPASPMWAAVIDGHHQSAFRARNT